MCGAPRGPLPGVKEVGRGAVSVGALRWWGGGDRGSAEARGRGRGGRLGRAHLCRARGGGVPRAGRRCGRHGRMRCVTLRRHCPRCGESEVRGAGGAAVARLRRRRRSFGVAALSLLVVTAQWDSRPDVSLASFPLCEVHVHSADLAPDTSWDLIAFCFWSVSFYFWGSGCPRVILCCVHLWALRGWSWNKGLASSCVVLNCLETLVSLLILSRGFIYKSTHTRTSELNH